MWLSLSEECVVEILFSDAFLNGFKKLYTNIFIGGRIFLALFHRGGKQFLVDRKYVI